jgi:hypothetical protein
MFKIPVADVSLQGYQVAPKPKFKVKLKPKYELVGGAALPTIEQKTKELFEMFGLQL